MDSVHCWGEAGAFEGKMQNAKCALGCAAPGGQGVAPLCTVSRPQHPSVYRHRNLARCNMWLPLDVPEDTRRHDVGNARGVEHGKQYTPLCYSNSEQLRGNESVVTSDRRGGPVCPPGDECLLKRHSAMKCQHEAS